MDQLKDIRNSLTDVKTTIFSVQEEYMKISKLETTLSELRKEANRHKQMKAAKENVKNIINVNDLERRAKEHIEKNELLLAHKCVMDLEKCRNDIFEELGDKSNNMDDIILVDNYFKSVKELNNSLYGTIKMIVKRMLDVSKTCPQQLVTALRIVEREEM